MGDFGGKMKKISEDIIKVYGPIRITLDDLKTIILKINKVIEDEDVKDREITIGGYSFEDINEIEKLTEDSYPRAEIKYHLVKEKISLILEISYHSHIYISDNSTFSLGLFNQIEQILLQYQSKETKRKEFLDWAPIAGLALTVFNALLFYLKLITSTIFYIIIGCTLLVSMYMLFFMKTSLRQKYPASSGILLREKPKKKSFIEENKGPIINGIFGIIGTIIGSVVTYLLMK